MKFGQIVKWSNDEFKWELNNYSMSSQRNSVKKTGYPYVESPEFSTVNEGVEYKWSLSLYPDGDGEQTKGLAEICLMSMSDKSCRIAFSVIIGQNGKTREYEDMLPSVKFEPKFESWSTNLIKRSLLFDKASDLLLNDTLNLFCRIIHDDTDFQMKNDLENVVDNMKFGDVKLILNNEQKLDAHKDILSSRSTVFAAMFEHNMKEKESNEVRIEDVEYEVMKETLRFIYSGRVRNLEKFSKELLKAAEKYALDGLKTICERYLCETMNVDNSTKCLTLAYIFNAETLKEFVMDFVTSHGKEIVDKPELMNELANLPKNSFPDVVRSLIIQYTSHLSKDGVKKNSIFG